MDLQILCHSSIKMIENEMVIYIDPFRIKDVAKDADVIFITHSHYDHFSPEDILKIKGENTNIIVTNDLYEKTLELGFDKTDIYVVEPNQLYEINNVKFKTIPAYNTNKKFHPKENGWVGYIIDLNDIKYYIAGDTDITEENKLVDCDVALIPIGGTYTTTYEEAAELTNIIKPKKVIPTHYGEIVGEKDDANKFKKLIDSSIECEILI